MPATAKVFQARLLKILENLRWEWSLDSRDADGHLGRALREVYATRLEPDLATIFPSYAAMEIRDGTIWVKEGRRLPWRVLQS